MRCLLLFAAAVNTLKKEFKKRPRPGRPAIGDPTVIRLSDEHRATAVLLGDGVVAEGVRAALDVARLIGEEAVREQLSGRVRRD